MQGGVSVNDEKVTDPTTKITLDNFTDNEMIVKKGKKVYHRIVIK